MRGSGKRAGISCRGDALDRRPARILEAEQPGDLVERLAGGVVPGCGEPLRTAVLAEHDAFRVSAADQQRQKGWLELGVRKPGAVHVAGEVRDADDRQAACHRGARRVHGADDQAAGQTRAPRDGDGIDCVPAAGNGGQRGVDHRGESFEMCASCQLGNDSAVDGVQGDL